MDESRHFQFCKCSYCAKADARRQRSKEVVNVKLKQIADSKKFDDYDEVQDLRQEKITGAWIVVKKAIDGKEGINPILPRRGVFGTTLEVFCS